MSHASKSLTLYPPIHSKYGVSYSHESPITIAPLTLTVPPDAKTISKKSRFAYTPGRWTCKL